MYNGVDMAQDYRNTDRMAWGLQSQESTGGKDGIGLEFLFCFCRLLIPGKAPNLFQLYLPYLCKSDKRIQWDNVGKTLRATSGGGFSVQSLRRVQLCATPGTVARQAPLSMGFPRKEYWRGLPFPSPGDLPDPGD